MTNQQLFNTLPQAHVSTAVNHAGGNAYSLTSKQALAQIASTGCFGNTYYAAASDQLDEVLKHAANCEVSYVAKVAVYARQLGHMKDMPAILLAHLCSRGPEGLLAAKLVFPRVIDNGKMARNFAQIVRSGKTSRKSFGSAPRRMLREWFASRSSDQLFRDSVGKKPSLSDLVKMVRPNPVSDDRKALYAYLIGKPYTVEHLPELVRAYENYKVDRSQIIPDVPFQMLDSLNLDTAGWTTVAKNAGWQMTRMNLNTFKRHGVLDNTEMVSLLATRLRNVEEINKARVFPYQLLMAYLNASDIPAELTNALQDAMEHSLNNVPSYNCNVVVCVDVSGSMSSPITGQRQGATSKARCIDIAALIAAAILRKNPNARVIPFETDVVDLKINPRDSVMTLATQIASVGGGGTTCSAPLALLNEENANADLVIYVSDNESWADRGYRRGTGLSTEWLSFKRRNRKAKLVCIDLTPNQTAQVITDEDRLNVGGFSDAVFGVISSFIDGGTKDAWVEKIETMIGVG